MVVFKVFLRLLVFNSVMKGWIPIVASYNCPLYPRLGNDIAFLKVKSPLPDFNNQINCIELPTGELLEGNSMTAAGWGHTGTGSTSTRLKEVGDFSREKS